MYNFEAIFLLITLIINHMKKFIFALTALVFFGFSFSGMAQDKMEIYNSQGQLIENGSHLVNIFSNNSARTIHTDSLFIKNISEANIKLKVRKINTNLVSGTFSVFTALAQDMAAEESITPNYFDLASGATTSEEAHFLGTYYHQNITGTSGLIYSFLSVDENDVVLDSVYVSYTFTNTSVAPMNQAGDLLYHREIIVECNASDINEYPINLHNHTIDMVSYRVAKTINQVEEGQEMSFRFGAVDYGHADNASNADGVDIDADELLTGTNGFVAKFMANEIDGNEFMPSVSYKFFNKSSGNDADYVTLIYNITGVGFAELQAYDISSAYPNPASDYFTVDHKLPSFTQAQLKVYNSAGSLLARFPIVEQNASTKVNVTDFPAGMYLLSIEIDGQSIGIEKMMID